MVPPFFGWNRFVYEGFGTSCTFDYNSKNQRDRIFTLSLLLGDFLVPLAIIIVSYVYILRVLFRRGRHLTCLNSGRENSSVQSSQLCVYYSPKTNLIGAKRTRSSTRIVHSVDDRFVVSNLQKTEARVTRNALLICAIFCLSWGPYAVMTMLTQVGFARLSNPYTSNLLSLLTKTAACVNPLIYAFASAGFRKRIRLNRDGLNSYFSTIFHPSYWSKLSVRSSVLSACAMLWFTSIVTVWIASLEKTIQ